MTDKSLRRPFPPKIVTANDLMEGDAIYFTVDHKWSREHEEAAVVTNADRADDLLAIAAKQADKIVGAYLADVKIGEDGRPHPVHFREIFRTKGPSNYHHGKQEVA